MAGHYTERAALLPLPASKKLVLMCIADSANWDNRVGFPGLDAIKQWSGLRSNSRVLEVIAELVAEGYLVRHRGGVNGRRAEFVVFPHGCCALHEPLSGYSAELPADPGSGSGVADPENSQVPVEGPIEGPAQTGPLPSSVPTGTTSAGTSRKQGSDSEGPAPSPSAVADAVSPPSARDRAGGGSVTVPAGPPLGSLSADRPSLPPTAEVDPSPRRPSGPPAELDGPGHAEFRRLRLVLACSLCDSAGLLPVGEPCTHPRRDEAATG